MKYIIITLIYVVLLYLSGITTNSSGVIEWTSFKLNTTYFLFLTVVYIITMYLIKRYKSV